MQLSALTIRFKTLLFSGLFILLPITTSAGLIGDTVTASYRGNLFVLGYPSPDSASAIIGPGFEFTPSLSRTGTTVYSDFSDNGLTIILGYHGVWSSGVTPMFVVDYSFASTTISSVSFDSLTYTGDYFCCGSGLNTITLTSPNSFELQFSSLWAPAELKFNIITVPEPETIVLFLIGLTMVGLFTRRKQRNLG
ncbi:MAG: PEP-CTERM sorting domain-containing protein [Rhodoferax sp.]|uniref:PEP-CTERM sorting domain-containing protein n=1 Tax=Rhodoferax sp. TaxID=50421 RepID=UPI00260578A9|nr:PEP-CTERM sorting domain-containing protein [Rhodoferax sp.]MDD2880447.1 PEP-CTERM sorting domain-containing protein [Rhodoferax sp.]